MSALSLVVRSGGYDSVHYALVMASTAAALGRPVILFFTGRALLALEAGAPDAPGWHALGPADDASPPAARDAAYAAARVATLEEMLEAIALMGVRVIACEMGWRVLEMERGHPHGPLRPDLAIETAGMATLLRDTPPGAALLHF